MTRIRLAVTQQPRLTAALGVYWAIAVAAAAVWWDEGLTTWVVFMHYALPLLAGLLVGRWAWRQAVGWPPEGTMHDGPLAGLLLFLLDVALIGVPGIAVAIWERDLGSIGEILGMTVVMVSLPALALGLMGWLLGGLLVTLRRRIEGGRTHHHAAA